MLDVVVLPDGSIQVLDRDELDQALADRFISPEQHAQALAAGDKLINWLYNSFESLVAFCDGYYKTLLAVL
jgi:predicted RNA-binding protein associated with RNAse of E/G family